MLLKSCKLFSFSHLTLKGPKWIMHIAEFSNRVDPDKPAQNEPSHLDIHCLPSCLRILNRIQLQQNTFWNFADLTIFVCFLSTLRANYSLYLLDIKGHQISVIPEILDNPLSCKRHKRIIYDRHLSLTTGTCLLFCSNLQTEDTSKIINT